jgi:hypothetical protein
MKKLVPIISKQRQSSSECLRCDELEHYAQQTAYQSVPSQEEMLNSGQPIPNFEPRTQPNPVITEEMDILLYEAAQQGNIGGD